MPKLEIIYDWAGDNALWTPGEYPKSLDREKLFAWVNQNIHEAMSHFIAHDLYIQIEDDGTIYAGLPNLEDVENDFYAKKSILDLVDDYILQSVDPYGKDESKAVLVKTRDLFREAVKRFDKIIDEL
jgi:hypothetical protein